MERCKGCGEAKHPGTCAENFARMAPKESPRKSSPDPKLAGAAPEIPSTPEPLHSAPARDESGPDEGVDDVGVCPSCGRKLPQDRKAYMREYMRKRRSG